MGNILLYRDITMQKENEERLKHHALQDSLTGLPNRRHFRGRLMEALEEFHENKDGLAVIMLDIDHFKTINDSMGHDVGDSVIEEFGKRVQRNIRDNDVVARLGGDEFVILLPNIGSVNHAVTVVDNIQKSVQEPWHINGHSPAVRTSVGIAMDPINASGFSKLKNADLALYEAKGAGRDAYKIRVISDHIFPSKQISNLAQNRD